jgi:hypothetical protein
VNLRYALPLLVCLTPGCERPAEIYRPPAQRRPYEIAEPKRLGHFAAMSAENATDHILGGVLLPLHDNQWRWTLQEPVLRFTAPRANGLKFRLDYTVPELTFRDTGPVAIEVRIGACLLDTISVQKGGSASFEKPVPPECLTTARPVIVRLKVDKTWQGAQDRQPRGFVLTGAGFVE